MANRPERGKGSARTVRINKAVEAVKRNDKTVADKRRQFWRDRGFTRQSQAASLISGIVVLTNAQAKERSQRASDWGYVPTEITEQMI